MSGPRTDVLESKSIGIEKAPETVAVRGHLNRRKLGAREHDSN